MGFGFHDLAIKDKIRCWLGSSATKHLVIVERDEKRLKENPYERHKKVKTIPASIENVTLAKMKEKCKC